MNNGIVVVPKKVKRKIISSISKLILYNPFFGVLLLQQKIIYDNSIPTFATDGNNISINPSFAESVTPEETQGILVHELMHTILMHMTRLNGRDHKIFNYAADYVINPIIKKEGFVLPKNHLDKDKYHGKTADSIYNMLIKDPEDISPDLIDIIPQKHLSESEKARIEQRTKISVAGAIAAAGDAVPDSIKSLIKEILKAKVDWKTKLREFIQVSLGNDETTWSRPNRNYLYKGLYLPSPIGRSMPSIAIMIDTSGSIYSNEDLFKAFAEEINNIVEDMVPEQVDIFHVDTSVKGHDTFDEGELPEYNLCGGGGTSFVSAWPEMEKIDPACIIAFTDAYADFPKNSSISTMWMVYGNKDPVIPFGEITLIEE